MEISISDMSPLFPGEICFYSPMKVTVYTSQFCKYCHLAKQYFKDNNIKYEEIDVTKNRVEAQKIMEEIKTLSIGLPIIKIDKNVVVGWNKGQVEKYLGNGT
jgi:glutaredoxin 3